MKLPDSEHTSRPWRIHELTEDFTLLDVWALPTPGGPTDFPRLVQLWSSFDPTAISSRSVRALFAGRAMLGELFGWDDEDSAQHGTTPTVRDRLPPELRESPSGPPPPRPFAPVYLTDDEWAAELVNRTVHGVVHLGWVADPAGGFRGQMAILVKPNGLLGAAYLAAISPFRHLIVYPRMLREIERMWLRRRNTPPPPTHRVSQL
jgi:hypothetical protein